MTVTAPGGRAVRRVMCSSAGPGVVRGGAARTLPRAGSSLSAVITDVLSDHHILQELEPEAETSWKAQGTLAACPPGLWAITWSPADFHHLRALSVGSPERRRQANHSFSPARRCRCHLGRAAWPWAQERCLTRHALGVNLSLAMELGGNPKLNTRVAEAQLRSTTHQACQAVKMSGVTFAMAPAPLDSNTSSGILKSCKGSDCHEHREE